MSPGASERVLDLVEGHRTTAVVCAAIDLGIIEALAAGPQTSRWVAAKCSTHESATHRLLIALHALGVCERMELGRFQLSDMGEHLIATATPSLRDWALFEGRMLARSWLELSESVRSGKTLGELFGGQARYENLDRDPGSASLFDAAMISMTRLVARDILAAFDFSGAGRILDVGGGAGALLIEILRANPAATGCVLDLPRCAQAAHRAIADAGMISRADFVSADFFTGLPRGFDTVVLKSVLHNWDDARSTTLLAQCRRSLDVGGRIVIAERLLISNTDAPGAAKSTALSDLNMLLGPGGCERSEAAYRKLAADAGLTVVDAVPAGRYGLLIAEAEGPC